MLQLKILSGKLAGTTVVACHFPFRIGRGAAVDWRLEEPGIWEQHLAINLDLAEGFQLEAQPNALVRVNREPLRDAALRNGDVIELGSVNILATLAASTQLSLLSREAFTWLLIAGVTASQFGVIYWLMS